ncbi:MAG: hypothetical protein KF688_02945 [Pirellulales bacterium]|nr:hypothetical protein [Pirellulales bacterium]
MGFLKQFFSNVFQEESPGVVAPDSSFELLTEAELEGHLGVSRYGSFVLTDAVRPSYGLEVVPSAGFRHDVYRDESSKRDVPVLMAAASRDELFDVFMELLAPLGPEVDVVLESSHDYGRSGRQESYREHIDMPILQSILYDFEDLLVNDGCTGIAVLNPSRPQEVQFDEHKLLIVYGADLTEYERALIDGGLYCREEMRFITEAEHVHSTTEEYIEQFEALKMRLGMDAGY